MIHPEEIFKKIGFILNDLQDQHDYLSHHPEKLNQPELQLFQANADFLADHIKIYLSLYQEQVAHNKETTFLSAPTAEAPVDEENEIDQPIIPEMEEFESRIDNPIDLLEEEASANPTPRFEQEGPRFEFLINEDSETTETFEFEKNQVDQIFDRTLSEEESEILKRAKEKINRIPENIESEVDNNSERLDVDAMPDDEVGPEPFLIPEVKKELVAQVEEPEPKSIITPLAEEEKKPSINELLASASGIRSSTIAPISDLKQAINLNDKLLFIRDLFNGYNLAYAEAIDLLNKMTDFKSADSFLQKTYAEKNGWAEKESTVIRFYDLLERRFPKDH